MSSTSNPITPARFAAALKDLTLPSLYAKASELRNSIAHLRRSNAEMQSFIVEQEQEQDQKKKKKEGGGGGGGGGGDAELAEHIWDNLAVIRRHEERLDLLRREVVEERGLPWLAAGGVGGTGGVAGAIGDVQPGRLSPGPEDEDGEEGEQERRGAETGTTTGSRSVARTAAAAAGGGGGGSLGDAELARRLADRMREDLDGGGNEEDDDEGVHL